MLQTVSQNVGMKRSAISVDTGRFVRIDVPKSQRSTPLTKRTNCCGSGRSSPRSLRTSSTVSGVASGPGGEPRRIARQHVDEQEDEQADEQQRRQQAQQALDDVLSMSARASLSVAEQAARRAIYPASASSFRRCAYFRSISLKLNDASGIT